MVHLSSTAVMSDHHCCCKAACSAFSELSQCSHLLYHLDCCFVFQKDNSNLLGTQELQAVLTSITDAEAALPSTASWVTAELIEGAAYTALPTPKAGVLTAITNTVTDLNSKITTVSPCAMPYANLAPMCVL